MEKRGVLDVAMAARLLLRKNPEEYFVLVEREFDERGVTADADRYYRLLAALDEETLREVESVVVKPPAANKYRELKNAILGLKEPHEASSAQLVSRLLTEERGDRSWERLYADIKRATSHITAESLARDIWVEKLGPEARKTVLAAMVATPSMTTEDTAKLATALSFADIEGQTSPRSRERAPPAPAATQADTRIDALVAQMAEMMRWRDSEARRSPPPRQKQYRRGGKPQQQYRRGDNSRSENSRGGRW